MMDITVKTLDGQNRTYSIPEKMTVKEFKGRIASSIDIPADVQRLIFQGRVMQDDKQLKDYDVHGKVIHVVQRLPPSARATTTTGSATSTTSTPPGGATARDMNRILIGSFNMPSGALDPNNVQNIVQQAVTSMGEMGRNARVSTSVSNDGTSLDVQIHLGQIPGATESESQLRINHARRMLGLAREKLNRLERGEGDNQEPSASSGQAAETSTLPMDTTEEEPTPSTSTNQETASSTTASTSAQSETATQAQDAPPTSQSNAATGTGNNNQAGEQNQPSGPIRPNVSVVADVLDEVHEVNRRLQPFLERYQQIVRDDMQLSPEETRQQQSVCNLVSEILHGISHCYHSLSDLLVDFSEPPPRQLYTAIVPVPVAVPTAVIQQTIPVHAQINVGGSPRLVQRNMGTQSTVPTSTQSTTTSQASANAASQTPPSQSTVTGNAGASTEPVTTGATNGTAPSGATPTTSSNGAPTVTRASTDPYVFLEVGPDHAVTVNSITAHVISSESEVPSTSASSTGSTNTGPQGAHNLTADLLQNIVSSVMQAHADPRVGMMHTVSLGSNRQNRQNNMSRSSATAQAGGAQANAAGATPITNSSGTQTTSSANAASHSGTQTTNTSTNSSGTQTGTGPRTAAFIMPGLPGALPGLGQGIPGLGAGIPGLGSGIPRLPGSPTPLDPFLQCNSRHFLRERAAQNQSQNGSTSAPGSHNTRQEFRGGRPEAFADMMINLISEMNPHLQGGRPTSGAPPTTNSTTTSTTGGVTSTTGTAGTNSNSSTQQASQPATSSATSTAASSTATSTSSAGIPPLMNPFAGMMQGMTGLLQGMMAPQPGATTSQMPIPMPMPGLAAMFGQMAQGMQGPRPPTASGSRPAAGATTGSSGAQPEPAFVNELRNLLQTNNPPSNSSTTATTSTPSSSTSSTAGPGGQSHPAMTDEAFTQLVQGIGNMVTQTAMGNPPTQSISDFLSNLGENYSISSSGGFFNDIFHCVSTQLTFPDLIQVFYGNRQPLNRVRVPLQQFIRERVLQNEEYTSENMERGVDRLLQEMADEVQAVESISEVKPGIDLTATLNGFLRKQMLAVCRMIMNSDDTNTNFGGHFYEKVRRILAELLILTRSCLVGGQPALERLIQNRLTFITAGVNPMIQQWMVAVTTQQVNQFLPTITVQEEDVGHYIIRTSENKKGEDKKKPEKKEDVASTSSSPMDTSSPVTSLGAAQLDSPEAMDIGNGAEEAVVSSTSDVQKPKPDEAVKDSAKVKVTENVTNGSLAESPGAAAGNESWQAEVPQEWVPIITNDVEKQKHQRPQQPLSDTYLQGMPAKRRKLMSHDGQMNLSNAAQTVPESIRRAVAAAGVEPISSVENLTSEATNNKELEQAFDEQVASSISDRLDSDSDYKAERFPNTEQYCRKNKK